MSLKFKPGTLLTTNVSSYINTIQVIKNLGNGYYRCLIIKIGKGATWAKDSEGKLDDFGASLYSYKPFKGKR